MGGVHFHGVTFYEPRLEAPLFYGHFGSWHEQAWPTLHGKALNRTLLRNNGMKDDSALYMGFHRNLRIGWFDSSNELQYHRAFRDMYWGRSLTEVAPQVWRRHYQPTNQAFATSLFLFFGGGSMWMVAGALRSTVRMPSFSWSSVTWRKERRAQPAGWPSASGAPWWVK